MRVAFDTLSYANKLKAAGFSEKIAEAQVEVQVEMLNTLVTDNIASKSDLKDSRLLAKQDLRELRTELKTEIQELRTELKAEIQELRTELKAEIQELRAELKADIQELRTELKVLENKLTLRFGAIVVGTALLLGTWMTFLTHFH